MEWILVYVLSTYLFGWPSKHLRLRCDHDSCLKSNANLRGTAEAALDTVFLDVFGSLWSQDLAANPCFPWCRVVSPRILREIQLTKTLQYIPIVIRRAWNSETEYARHGWTTGQVFGPLGALCPGVWRWLQWICCLVCLAHTPGRCLWDMPSRPAAECTCSVWKCWEILKLQWLSGLGNFSQHVLEETIKRGSRFYVFAELGPWAYPFWTNSEWTWAMGRQMLIELPLQGAFARDSRLKTLCIGLLGTKKVIQASCIANHPTSSNHRCHDMCAMTCHHATTRDRPGSYKTPSSPVPFGAFAMSMFADILELPSLVIMAFTEYGRFIALSCSVQAEQPCWRWMTLEHWKKTWTCWVPDNSVKFSGVTCHVMSYSKII